MINDDYIPYLKLNLSFFDGEKTEQPTSQKRSKARDEGQVAKSTEVTTAFALVFMFASLGLFSTYMFSSLIEVFNYSVSLASRIDEIYNEKFIISLVFFMFSKVILIVIPILMVAMAIGIITNLIQVGWKVTTKPLMPKFSKLNPISGVKRMFSLKAVLELFKSITKLTIISIVAYNAVKKRIHIIPLLTNMTVSEIAIFMGDTIINLGITIGAAYMFIALIDYAYTRWKHTKDLKMSKQEVKDEYKNSEGNPLIKGQIRQRMREASMRRMMSDLPTADVIITNPTHYAIAIKYDKDVSPAPIVVAKGADHMAKRIREIGLDNQIELVENKPLARTLYTNVEVGEAIPPELYKTVAEILAYVYKLKNNIE